MTRDEIMRMADECGIPEFENNESQAANILLFATRVWNAALEKAKDELKQFERELEETKEQLRLCNVDQLTTAAELADAQEELNDRRKFSYAVELALEGFKGDYIEIIKELVAAKKSAEPVAWRYQNGITETEYLVWQKGTGGRNWTPLYAAPPRREWVGLTDDEVFDLADENLYNGGKNYGSLSFNYGVLSFYKDIEAKLREKNT